MGAFRTGFCGVFLQFPVSTVPTLDLSHMPAWTSTCMYLTSVQGWGGGGGWGGLMTSMRMRLTCTVFLSGLCIGGEGRDGGDVDDVDVVLHDADCICGR